MILISTLWSLDKFTHLVHMAGSDLLKCFLDGVFAQVIQITPSETFGSSLAWHGELAAWEKTLMTPHTNAHEVYLIERAKYLGIAIPNDPTTCLDVGTHISSSFTNMSTPTGIIPAISVAANSPCQAREDPKVSDGVIWMT